MNECQLITILFRGLVHSRLYLTGYSTLKQFLMSIFVIKMKFGEIFGVTWPYLGELFSLTMQECDNNPFSKVLFIVSSDP